MRAAALVWVSLLGLAAACSADPAPMSAPPAPSTAVTAPTPELRQSLPTVPGDDRRSIPRVDGIDAAPPQLTTRTTVLAGNRPALVVTLAEAVLFPFGSAELRPDAEAALHQVVDLLRRRPAAHAEVGGHTDSVGSVDYNHVLSQQRAVAVVDWLVAHDVPRSLLHPVGYGATRPVAGNAAEEDRRRNRRVELTVRDA
ncbi:MAG TPA: OmpA family protein [Acidimicrobiales bacterium]|nr:OmpA family protein [Acidimicrobiales bacterium]